MDRHVYLTRVSALQYHIGEASAEALRKVVVKTLPIGDQRLFGCQLWPDIAWKYGLKRPRDYEGFF